ncbi:MAG TPA: zinc ribbon domain-containing protein [Pyrinomonadaceae bacterium]|nr:zinc ribbon domain-containing protein [Pyrinomonadaceae bacterium]
MFCPSCGSEIPVEMKYCNRCGANLAVMPVTYPTVPPPKPIRLTLPAIVMGLTICISMGLVIDGAQGLAERNIHPAAIAWIVIACMATLFGCSALMVRFLMKIMSLNREAYQHQYQPPQIARPVAEAIQPPRFTPRLQPQPSVTEHTTRTFTAAYREGSDPDNR